MFKCRICGKQFKNKKALDKHFYYEHSATMQDERDRLQNKVNIIKDKIATLKKQIKENKYD